jgi:hypothetical protein
MSDWKVIDTHSDLYDEAEGLAATIITAPFKMLAGKPPSREQPYKTYTVENEDTGEVKRVRARDRYELGDRISEGEFVDDD